MAASLDSRDPRELVQALADFCARIGATLDAERSAGERAAILQETVARAAAEVERLQARTTRLQADLAALEPDWEQAQAGQSQRLAELEQEFAAKRAAVETDYAAWLNEHSSAEATRRDTAVAEADEKIAAAQARLDEFADQVRITTIAAGQRATDQHARLAVLDEQIQLAETKLAKLRADAGAISAGR